MEGMGKWKPDSYNERKCIACGEMFLPNYEHPERKCNKCIGLVKKARRAKLAEQPIVPRKPTEDIRRCKTCGTDFEVDKKHPRNECYDCRKEKEYIRREKEKDKVLEQKRRSYSKNANKQRDKDRAKRKMRIANDPIFAFQSSFRSLFKVSIKSRHINKNRRKIEDILPYTILEAQKYLENLFEPWMTWKNHGQYKIKTWKDKDQSTWTWQIDHIRPHSTFNYSSFEDQDFKDCWALENLRPLLAKQNITDHNNRDEDTINEIKTNIAARLQNKKTI